MARRPFNSKPPVSRAKCPATQTNPSLRNVFDEGLLKLALTWLSFHAGLRFWVQFVFMWKTVTDPVREKFGFVLVGTPDEFRVKASTSCGRPCNERYLFIMPK